MLKTCFLRPPSHIPHMARIGLTATLMVGCAGAPDAALDGATLESSGTSALSASGGGTLTPVAGGNMCLNTFYSHEENGSAVEISTCTGTSSQNWDYSNGALKVFGNKCVDVIDGVAKNGTQLQLKVFYYF